MLGAAGAAITAISAVFTVGPESGGLGVIMVDAFFGAFILFIASRFLWIYAAKRSQALDAGASNSAQERE